MNLAIKMPVSDDPLGRWMEKHGACVEISCSFAKFSVTVSWRRVHSYSDAKGSHVETWSVERSHENLQEAMGAALAEASAQTEGKR